METETWLLLRAGPYTVGQEIDGETIERIELRTDGHGPTGFYDVIYLYIEGREQERAAMPAHQCDYWAYQ